MFLVPVTRPSSELARSFDRLFDDTFERLLNAGPASEGASRSPVLDVAETDNAYSVAVDLPGVAKEDVKITIDGRRVSVSAQAQAQREQTKQDATGNSRVIHRERSSASYARSFTLPEEVDQGASQARLDNGVLTLSLAKKRATAATQLTIN
jgi:HSP20 family protein